MIGCHQIHGTKRLIPRVYLTTCDPNYSRERTQEPILRNHPHLSLFVSRRQAHANPILSRCRFTLSSNSATRLTICGSGVSYRSASSLIRCASCCLTRSTSPSIAASRVASHLLSSTYFFTS